VIPPPPAPNYQQTAGDYYNAQLQYNPQLAAQYAQLQAQYGPQLAQNAFNVQSQLAPQYYNLASSLYPQIPQLSQQVSEKLTNPYAYSASEQTAIDALRAKQAQKLQESIQTSANLGGGLYGGRRELREDQALTDLGQQYAVEDVNRLLQNRQQALSELATLFQISFPNVQQPGIPDYAQGIGGANNLYSALVQNQGNFGIIPGVQGTPGAGAGLAQGIGTGVAAAGMVKAFVFCVPGNLLIDTTEGTIPIEEVNAGDNIRLPDGALVRITMKHQYAPDVTPFVRVVFEDGTSIEACERHLVSDKCLGRYAVGEQIQGKTISDIQKSTRLEMTYDLLTDAAHGGYASSGIVLNSMIPLFHHLLAEAQLQGVV
jgi:hypothetical protein